MPFKACIKIMVFIVLSCLFVSPAMSEPIRIIGFGDSLMAGYQLGPGEGFTDQLQSRLREEGYEVEIANAGVSGDTTSGGLSRLDWSVPDGTDLVILELGANDALRGISPEITRRNLDEMITRLKSRNIRVLLAGMVAPPNMGPDYADSFNPIYTDLAKQHDIVLYPFFLDGVAAQMELLLDDGMHPNAQGIALMVDRFYPAIAPLLEEKQE